MKGTIDFDICIYHNPCSDGLASAWIVKTNIPNIELFSYKFQSLTDDKTIALFTDKKIIFVDCAPKLTEIDILQKICKKILVLDHHKTNKDVLYNELNTKIEFVYNEKQSGCQIVWEYFHKDLPIPWFINYIADRDLWTWKLPNSKTINTGLFNDEHITFNGLDKLLSGDTTFDTIFNIGTIYERIMEKEINKCVKTAIPMKYNEYNIWVFSGNPEYRSDAGNKLLDIPFADGTQPSFTVFWQYNIKGNEFWLSFRGNDNSPDLTLICSKYGGGGHKNASGCTIKSITDIFTNIE